MRWGTFACDGRQVHSRCYALAQHGFQHGHTLAQGEGCIRGAHLV